MTFPFFADGIFDIAFGEAGIGTLDDVVEAPIHAVDVEVKVAAVGGRLAESELGAAAKFIAGVLRLASRAGPLPAVV